MARVVALHIKPGPGELEPVERLTAIAGEGFENDVHRGRRHRQVLFVAQEHLDEFGYRPGDLREQVTVDLPGLQQLEVGTVVRVGEAHFEVESDCAPCARQAARMGEEAESFQARTAHKRGVFMRVRVGAPIQVGDEVTVVG